MRISDWSSDVCSSDLAGAGVADFQRLHHVGTKTGDVAMAADDGDAGARRDDARTGDDPVIGGTAKGEDRLRVGPEVADGGEAGLGRQKRVPGATRVDHSDVSTASSRQSPPGSPVRWTWVSMRDRKSTRLNSSH